MPISFDYVAKETAQNLWRNRVMALAAVLTVAVSLSLVGTALLLRQAVARQIGEWSNNVSLQIFMDPGATQAQVASVRQLIHETPQITRFTYLNHQQSYKYAKKILASTPTAFAALTPATTPAVFRCQLKNPSAAPTVAALFTKKNGQPVIPGVFHAVFPGQSIHIMQRVTSVLQDILIAIAIVLLVSSLVLILNAIRMAIFARRREVSVMKLVGATNWFIRIPFMLEGFVQGLLGAVVAVFVVLLANIGVRYLVAHYKVTVLSSTVLSSRDLLFTEIVVVLIGIAVGVAGSFVAIRRFLEV
ncbi:MAG: permease-like cell division protein FtsX [Acidimicrobiales bacterium]